jgi:hypothetical protein
LATHSRAKPSRGTRCVLARAFTRCSRYLTQLASAKLKQIATPISVVAIWIAPLARHIVALFLPSTSICGCSCAFCCHSDSVRRRHAPRKCLFTAAVSASYEAAFAGRSNILLHPP